MLRGQLPRYSSSPIEESPFGMLSDAEEREIHRARHGHGEEEDHDDLRGPYRHEEVLSDNASVHTFQSRHASDDTRDRDRRQMSRHTGHSSHADAVGSMGSMTSLNMAGVARSAFDFAAMEEFAASERQVLDVVDSAEPIRRRSTGVRLERSHTAVTDAAASGSGSSTRQDVSSTGGAGSDETVAKPYSLDFEQTSTMSPPMFSVVGDNGEPAKDEEPQTNFHRRRARKLSQSNPVRRGAKLALFESFGGGGDDNALTGSALKAPRQGRQVPTAAPTEPATGFQAYTDAPPGHDRPYRFSFYSNALPVTIHARTMAELPAEGQSFEDLFKGRNNSADTAADLSATPRPGSGISGMGTPNEPSLLTQTAPKQLAMKNALATSTLPPTAEEDPDQFTWWLDVLSPTDEEMRMLSKVFGIHPLTTEDILLEETREKIELFRHYYLVCFRSFDQDPYSQTYLEPLNMYIIVFREGTLSFHFRGTPHPQNVRRRIKHLKDYISVTSDWISYALIDDITDAFGPLIQSIEYEVDSIDELVLILKEAEQTDMLRRIGTCRKKVMGLLRLMGSKADVVKGLAKRCNENWLVAPKSDIGLYLSDIQDHLITMTSNLNHYEKILSRSHSNYLAQISIEMTDANNQINDVLSKLTALGTVLIPMNLVTGLWGMNVHVPGQDAEVDTVSTD